VTDPEKVKGARPSLNVIRNPISRRRKSLSLLTSLTFLVPETPLYWRGDRPSNNSYRKNLKKCWNVFTPLTRWKKNLFIIFYGKNYWIADCPSVQWRFWH